MKINLIIPSFYPATVYGGPIFSTLHTCEELAKLDDVEVRVSTTNANMTTKLNVKINKWQKFEKNFYVKYYNETIINKISLSLLFTLWRDERKADVIHIQSIFGMTTVIALIYANLLSKPILLSPRGSFGGWCIDNGSKFKNIWLKWLIQPLTKKTTWHATAQQEKDEILSIYSNAQVEIIPNGIEYDKFQKSNILSAEEFMQKFTGKNIAADKIIISMGRLQKKKGFDILINSFKEVLSDYPNAKLLIAGGDEGEKENLEIQIKELRLEDKVFLIGSISGQDKIDFLANANLFVLPSHNENFGNVYVESLAAGTPVVASTNTPWSEVIEFDCGQWVDNNIEKTSQAILKILHKDREQMRLNSKKLASKYDWKYIAQEFKKLYEKLMEIK